MGGKRGLKGGRPIDRLSLPLPESRRSIFVFGRDPIRAKGIMASGACESRIEGRTHGRTNQRNATRLETTCQREPSTHGQVRERLGLHSIRVVSEFCVIDLALR